MRRCANEYAEYQREVDTERCASKDNGPPKGVEISGCANEEAESQRGWTRGSVGKKNEAFFIRV